MEIEVHVPADMYDPRDAFASIERCVSAYRDDPNRLFAGIDVPLMVSPQLVHIVAGRHEAKRFLLRAPWAQEDMDKTRVVVHNVRWNLNEVEFDKRGRSIMRPRASTWSWRKK